MKTSPEEFGQQFNQTLGTLTLPQLWLLVKFAKHIRLRCRNNSALNNFLNGVFKYATFKQVTKTRKNRMTGQDESYPGLDISIDGQKLEITEDDES